MTTFSDKLQDVLDRGMAEAKDNPSVLYGIAGGAALLGALSLYSGRSGYKSKPSSFELGGGSIHATKVKAEFTNYSKAYGTSAGEGIRKEERINTAELVLFSTCMHRNAPARPSTITRTIAITYIMHRERRVHSSIVFRASYLSEHCDVHK